MASSLYDITVIPYRQTVDAMTGILEKGAEHCQQAGINLDELVNFSLWEDMLPFSFQIHSVVHHSLNSLKGVESGKFGPPKDLPELDYAGLQQLVADTSAALEQYSREQVDAMAGGEVLFSIGENYKLPFTTEGFVLTFSTPNLHFHATTAYDILRMKGVPLGKLDFMGRMLLKS